MATIAIKDNKLIVFDRNPKQFQNRALYMAFTRKINNQSDAADATLINGEPNIFERGGGNFHQH